MKERNKLTKALFLTLFCFVLLVVPAKAQEKTPRNGVQSQWKAHLGLESGISWEGRWGTNFLGVASVGMVMAMDLIPARALNPEIEYLAVLLDDGWLPYTTLGFRWLPGAGNSPNYNNTGFRIGLDVSAYSMKQLALPSAIRKESDAYAKFRLLLPIEYYGEISDRWSWKIKAAPSMGAEFRKSSSVGRIGIMLDAGVSYSF